MADMPIMTGSEDGFLINHLLLFYLPLNNQPFSDTKPEDSYWHSHCFMHVSRLDHYQLVLHLNGWQ
jgi:hypothetical protein